MQHERYHDGSAAEPIIESIIIIFIKTDCEQFEQSSPFYNQIIIKVPHQMIQPSAKPTNQKTFYFSYQLRIELIPYIHEQAEEFKQHCQSVDSQSDYHSKMLSLAKRRKEELEQFYGRSYMDFRAPLIVQTINLMRIILCSLQKNSKKSMQRRIRQQTKQSNAQDQGLNQSKESISRASQVKKQPQKQRVIPDPKLSLIIKPSSSPVLQIANKKSISNSKSKQLTKIKSHTSLSKAIPLTKSTQPVRKNSQEVSNKIMNRLSSSKELIQQKKQKVLTKPMSKSQYMTYLNNKQKSK